MDKISVIVPIYKVEKYMDKCVDSIVNQTYKNLEIILVDDGSPDNCPKLCDEWAKKDERIKVIHKENGGLSDARNSGLDICTGDYLMFVDSDDYLDTTICEKLLNLLKSHDADFSMSGVQIIFENQQLVNSINEINIKSYDCKNLQYEFKVPYLMTAWAKLYKKEIFNNIRYPKGKLHEDEFIIHEILGESKKCVISNEPLYYYLQRDNSIMSTKSEKNVQHILEAYTNRIEYLNEKYSYNKSQNYNYMLTLLRNFYLSRCLTKSSKNIIFEKFKEIYKTTGKHTFKIWLFRYFKWIYVVTLKLKNWRKK